MRKLISFIVIAFISLYSFIGCESNSDKSNIEKDSNRKNNGQISQSDTVKSNDLSGNYVSDSYSKRSEGYDWVAVTVKKVTGEEIFVSVRSRADLKKPTCTFDAKARKVNDSTYSTVAEGKNVIITFSGNTVKIATEKPEDEAALYFFCSGGATVAGVYSKINEALDEKQIDKTIFSKVLRLQNIGFNITTKPKDGKVELEIYPFGLKLSDQSLKQFIEGSVTDAEVEDMNSDGFPEVLVYTQTGENRKGDVIGTSVLKGNSMVQIYFPPVSDDSKINKGYNGFDEFTIIENSLSQRFPVFENGNRTGKIRQIQYKLEKGENLPKLVVKNVTEFDAPPK